MKNKKIIYISILMISLMALGTLGYNYLTNVYLENENNTSYMATNENLEKAPDFTVYDENNNKISLSDYTGKKNVVVNFWASWCPPCKAEMPYFKEAMDKYKDENVEILMVNLTDGMRETKEIANTFLKEQGYDMNLVYDLDSDAAMTYYLNAVPRTLFIDIDGNLKYDHTGIISNAILNNNIDILLNK